MTATTAGGTTEGPVRPPSPHHTVSPALRRSLLAALVVAAAALSFMATNSLYPTLTADHDEPVFILQAETFAEGRVTLPADDYGDEFRPWLSGERSGRLFLVFPPGWPALMALSIVVFGTTDLAVALVAALVPLLAFAFVREVWSDERVALVSAAAMTWSPFVLVQSATHLSYLVALPLELLVLWLVARGLRSAEAGHGWGRSPVMAGVALGLLLATRPLDALLTAVVIVVYVTTATWSTEGRFRQLVDLGLRLGAGGVVPVVLLGLYNLRVTGSPTVFPLAAAGGNNSFGFGERWIADGAPVETVTLGESAKALGLNLGELPFWIWGGILALPLVAWGALLVWRRSRPLAALLATVTLAFPLVNLLYWGNTLVVLGRKSLGPLYYMPLLIPVAVTTAVGLVALYERRRGAAFAVAVVLTAVTLAVDLPPKLSDALELRDDHRDEIDPLDEVAASTDRELLVIIPPSEDGAWVLHPRPYFANPPGLDGDILFAVDQGNDNIDLVERFPERRPYQLMPRAGADLLDPVRVPVRLQLVEGGALTMTSTITNTGGGPVVTAFADGPRRFSSCVLDESSEPGEQYEMTWILDDRGVGPDSPCPGDSGTRERPDDPDLPLVIGVGIGAGDFETASKSEYRVPVQLEEDRIRALGPGVPWVLLWVDGPKTPTSADVSATLHTTIEPASP